jgi:hypothetical protein
MTKRNYMGGPLEEEPRSVVGVRAAGAVMFTVGLIMMIVFKDITVLRLASGIIIVCGLVFALTSLATGTDRPSRH